MRDEALTGRALAAYFRTGGEFAMIPSESMSRVVVYNDKVYVSLRNGSDTLAVYQVRNDGIPKRLRRWPKAVENW